MANLRVNRMEYNPSTHELTVFTNGSIKYIFDMDLIGSGGSGGSVALDQITVIDSNQESETFDTLQEAFDSIPEATNATNRRIIYNVYIPSGTYDEALTINMFRRSINVICQGPVNIGLFEGEIYEASNARTITLNHVASSPALTEIDQIRDHISFSMNNNTDDGMPTHHTAYRNGLRVSGGIIAVDSVADAGSNLKVSLDHCRIFGTVDFTGHTNGVVRLAATNSFFNVIQGIDNVTFPGIYKLQLDYANNCKFADTVTVGGYGKIVLCRFYAGFSCGVNTFVSDLEPCGFFQCYIEGDFNGPSGSFRLDGVTNYFFEDNGGSLVSGATKVLLHDET